ncbi:MAG: T9SS type A sorting domain-containing protein, partial [Bacteroidales bacterium]
STGELIVEPPSGSRLLELYSVQGIKIGSYILNEENTFRLPLPPGMYLYKIYAGKCYTGKMLLP